LPGGRSGGRSFGEFELNPVELVLLGEACRTVDTLATIAAALDGVSLTTTGSTGQTVAHPLLAEARAQRRVLDQLCRALALPLPDERVGRRRSPSAREAALTRWARDGA
jgi:hypothetical protein